MDPDPDSESELLSLVTQLMFVEYFNLYWDATPLLTELILLVSSMDLDSQPKPESEFMSLTTQAISLFNSMELESQSKLLSDLMSMVFQNLSLFNSALDSEATTLFGKIISLVSSMDLTTEEKPESDELVLLIQEILSLVNSRDSDSQPKRLVELISFISQKISLIDETLEVKPEPELISLTHQILSLVVSMNSNSGEYISLCPQAQVKLENGRFRVLEDVSWRTNNKWHCLSVNWRTFKLSREEDTLHFICIGCNGDNHKEFNNVPVEINHPLHPNHSLQLVVLKEDSTRECYCCDEALSRILYYCSACDFAISILCARKPPVFLINHHRPEWHGHPLALFPRQAFLTCNLCALTDPSSPIYMCPPCDFVTHLRCINLPRVIKISRHSHRIYFTPSFDQEGLSCGVCRRKINKLYGGYSCIKNGCWYAAHSRCATQKNVWDGVELEGVPEENEEEVDPPFATKGSGVIRHFTHRHLLRLDVDTGRDYDEDKLCNICITPIYFGNFYSCTPSCDYNLHETCANFPRKIDHPIHPHQLNLEAGYGDGEINEYECSVCPRKRTVGFLYRCRKCFYLHVQCAIASEPLDHPSHIHPLYLTSKPDEEQRKCSVCKKSGHCPTKETFNCIEECDFALCFECATLAQKVRYKHDKHVLTLSYGDKTSTMTYWCEICEERLNPKERFYSCDEYCCVTIHIECLVGVDFYMKPGSKWFNKYGAEVSVLPNNHHMSRPFCSICKKRCPHKTFFQCNGFEYCSRSCLLTKSKEVIYLGGH
ncbi:unnamed protein product [Arabidopsis thaliana]|uniref:Cysteine/Histidine-rich C1 domain family protein n=1 Tax=Arabidopsis thaliana TaxID=3702 RepID=A0A5S9XL41_ARATH|nr:unnamed protein product [Arabidopsis thaliana]